MCASSIQQKWIPFILADEMGILSLAETVQFFLQKGSPNQQGFCLALLGGMVSSSIFRAEPEEQDTHFKPSFREVYEFDIK